MRANDAAQHIRDQLLDAVSRDRPRYVAQYGAMFGHVLNADNASELFEIYRASPDTRATLGALVRPAAAHVVDAMFTHMLARPVDPGRLPLAIFMSGGNGAGKSTLVPTCSRAHVIFDSTLSQFALSVDKIDRALAAGLDVRVRHVRRDPLDAWRAVLERAATSSQGRTVTAAGHVATHLGAHRTLLAVVQRYAHDGRVTFQILENRRDAGYDVRSLDWLRGQQYADEQILHASIRSALADAKERGVISDAIYRGSQGHSG